MESGAISTILDAHLEHALPGTASPPCGDSPAHPADGTRRLGSTADPRRAHEARFHRVRGDGIALHPAPACRARPSEALGRVLAHHKDDIAAMDLFTVPTASLRLLYGFFESPRQPKGDGCGRLLEIVGIVGAIDATNLSDLAKGSARAAILTTFVFRDRGACSRPGSHLSNASPSAGSTSCVCS